MEEEYRITRLKNEDLYDAGQIKIELNAVKLDDGIHIYGATITHIGLGITKSIKGESGWRDTSNFIIEDKIIRQAHKMDDAWNKQKSKEKLASSKETASIRTSEARRDLERLGSLLQETLAVNDRIDWEAIKDKSSFSRKRPSKSPYPKEPKYRKEPPAFNADDVKYRPVLTALSLFPSVRRKKVEEAKARYDKDYGDWLKKANDVAAANKELKDAYEARIREIEIQYKNDQEAWEQDRSAFYLRQKETNAAYDDLGKKYTRGESAAIMEYCGLVLARSNYPDTFPQEFELDYQSGPKILIVDYQVPAPADLSFVKEVKYDPKTGTFSNIKLSERDSKSLYDSVLYQICLRSVHELYEADALDALDSIVFNGWVTSIDKATGNEANSCIMSVQVRREEFGRIRLENVDPKTCFRAFKGISSAQLNTITPIAPILDFKKDDKRFVDSYAVTNQLDDSTNLAAMDWEDFEHLIRELFEEEFAKGGGEVKVTRASRDGGVDAVAFDPDPIRGGKIVIQAKRYTNTVGVSAVRDLYGTLLNEGATKGILVTTTDYGADAYDFARGKPITLLNGGNLLHLLEKHGHKARIDVQEAKRIFGDA